MLSKSETAAGYVGIRDYLIPIYQDFFIESTLYDDETKTELNSVMLMSFK